MKLFKLWRDEEDRIDFDEVDAFVVCAPDEVIARDLAARGSGDEGWAAWIQRARCRVIGTPLDGVQPGVVCRSFNAG